MTLLAFLYPNFSMGGSAWAFTNRRLKVCETVRLTARVEIREKDSIEVF